MVTVSVAIIAKNEEGCIERCLKSAKLFADEIVLVDNGSTDKTKEIALKYTSKVFDSERFDKDTHISDFQFGVAKNEAIRKCTCDWVMWMDADDVIDEANAKKIRQLVDTHSQNTLFNFSILYGSLKFEHCRMFPNGKGIFFDESHGCHEFLITQGLPISRNHINIDIVHMPGKKQVSACERNRMILEKDYLKRKRDDTRTLFYLGNAYRECVQYDKAIEVYDKYLEKGTWAEERFFVRIYKAFCLKMLKKLKDCRNELLRAIMEDDRYAESYCDLGDLYFEFGDFKVASAFYQMALTKEIPKESVLFTSPAKYSDYPRKKIQECQGDKKGIVTEEQAENISVCVTDSMSDVLLATGAIREYRKTHLNQKIVLCIKDDVKKELIKNTQDFEVVVGEPPSDVKRLLVPEGNVRAKKHDSDWYARCLGHVSKANEIIPSVGVDDKALEEAKKHMGDKNYVILQATPDFQGGEWDLDGWKKVVEFLKNSGFSIAQVDGNTIEGIEIVPGKAEFVKAFISLSSFVIGVDGWLHHLTAALGVPTIVMWGPTIPQNRGYSFQVNVKMKDLPCQPCWKLKECEREFECMKTIKPQNIIDCISKAFEEEKKK